MEFTMREHICCALPLTRAISYSVLIGVFFQQKVRESKRYSNIVLLDSLCQSGLPRLA